MTITLFHLSDIHFGLEDNSPRVLLARVEMSRTLRKRDENKESRATTSTNPVTPAMLSPRPSSRSAPASSSLRSPPETPSGLNWKCLILAPSGSRRGRRSSRSRQRPTSFTQSSARAASAGGGDQSAPTWLLTRCLAI